MKASLEMVHENSELYTKAISPKLDTSNLNLRSYGIIFYNLRSQHNYKISGAKDGILQNSVLITSLALTRVLCDHIEIGSRDHGSIVHLKLATDHKQTEYKTD